jgi:Na+/proline symporter|tara:strand:- start:347 stop:820 length:474 start_codon:yes stop_codon:yes gene_type:complete
MSHHEVLGFIELLLEPILAIIFELVVEVVFYGIFYKITEAISVGLNEASDSIESVANAADKTPEKRFGIILLLIISGIITGSLISFTFPERIIKISSITGISLLITPFVMGLIISLVGRRIKKRIHQPSLMTTFLGGAIFGLAAAGTRLIFITQMQT